MIQYVTGDATTTSGPGPKIIAHIYNDIGGWGKGFVMAISKKWKEPEQQYREWFASQKDFSLGGVQFVPVGGEIWVANIIGQRDVRGSSDGLPPIRYDALGEGLEKVGQFAAEHGATVHMPRIGCGLAGGTWEEVEPLIIRHLSDQKVPVTVYDFA